MVPTRQTLQAALDRANRRRDEAFATYQQAQRRAMAGLNPYFDTRRANEALTALQSAQNDVRDAEAELAHHNRLTGFSAQGPSLQLLHLRAGVA